MDREDLQVRLENALRRLLELGGVEIDKSWAGFSEEQWNYLDPMETMLYAPPSFWLDSAAQHLYEIATNCEDIVDDFNSLFKATSAGGDLSGDTILGTWAAIDDLEFHLFTSHLHTYLIRYVLFHSSHIQADVLKPVVLEAPALDAQWGADSFAAAVATGLEIPADGAQGIVDDVIALMRQCRFACVAVKKLGSESEAGVDVLGRGFADVQFACATLAAGLVRADMSVGKLSRTGAY